MSWFSGDAHITNTVAVTETRVIAGAAVGLLVIVILYFTLKTMLAYNKRTMAEAARKEVQLNNIITKQ